MSFKVDVIYRCDGCGMHAAGLPGTAGGHGPPLSWSISRVEVISEGFEILHTCGLECLPTAFEKAGERLRDKVEQSRRAFAATVKAMAGGDRDFSGDPPTGS